MSLRRIPFYFGLAFLLVMVIGIPITSQDKVETQANGLGLVAGRNVNMVAGIGWLTGDPFLQRQNEPSMAVSTRNPFNLLAGANDYRTVDYDNSWDQLPKNETLAAPQPDAWLGVFRSNDGGESWTSTLLPGFWGYDTTPTGAPPSPLIGYEAAADPVVRAGPNGMFYYCGIAFKRLTNESVVFVARFIDNNNKEGISSIDYIDTQIIDSVPAGTEFIDKPCIAVDIPRRPLRFRTVAGQQIYRHNVYVTYTVFDGTWPNLSSEIRIRRSRNCGNSWQTPITIASEEFSPEQLTGDMATQQFLLDKGIYQGSTIAIGPILGVVYVAWRQFAIEDQPNAIYIAKSYTRGWRFRPPKKVADIVPFDQPTKAHPAADGLPEGTIFRTNAYPTMTVDQHGRLYLAWAERIGALLQGRIVLTTSWGDFIWTIPQVIEEPGVNGHQFMPSLNYSNGKLTVFWYDQRRDYAPTPGDSYIIERFLPARHTIDVRATQANKGKFPSFSPSIQVSKYLYELVDTPGGWALAQKNFNHSNPPLFSFETVPFMGDYIDLTSLMFKPRDPGKWWQLPWKFNHETDPGIVLHGTWTDNRDVVLGTGFTPPNGAPSIIGCIPGQVGTRNQNVYTSRLTLGTIAGALGSSKYLNFQRAFVIFVKNVDNYNKYYQLTVDPPAGGVASFDQFDPYVHEQTVFVDRHSSISTTVFVESPNPNDSAVVSVVEVDESGVPIPGGFQTEIILNPDNTNPLNQDIYDAETHTPHIVNYQVYTVDNPHIVNNPEGEGSVNDDFVTPHIVNDPENPHIVNEGPNPHIVNQAIGDIPAGSEMTDATWILENQGNSLSSFNFNVVADENVPEGIEYQLLIYRIYTTPTWQDCNLVEEQHHETLVNKANPHIVNPHIVNPAPLSRDGQLIKLDAASSPLRDAKFPMRPGERVVAILRLFAPPGLIQAKDDFVASIHPAPLVKPHAINIDDGILELTIDTDFLPVGEINVPYNATLIALGGDGDYLWSELLEPHQLSNLPPGLTLNPDGTIDGTPTESGVYPFTAQVTDGVQIATKVLTIIINAPDLTYQLSVTTFPANGGTVDIYPEGTEFVEGTVVELAVNPNSNLGYQFIGWTGDVPAGHEMDNPLDITMDDNIELTAIFFYTTGLVSWWPGEGNGNDVFGGNHGTEYGSVSYMNPGDGTQAFDFDTPGDYILAPGDGIDNLNILTVEAWVRLNSIQNRIDRFVTITGQAGQTYLPKAVIRHDGGFNPGSLHFYITVADDGWAMEHLRVNNVLQAGCWHHVVGTYDGSFMRLYLDGIEVGNRVMSGAMIPGDNQVWLSFPPGEDPNDETLLGSLDDARIYNWALSLSEIQDLYTRGHGTVCSPQPTPASEIAGTARYNTGDPIPNIEITITGSYSGTAITDGNGEYSFAGLGAGYYNLNVTDDLNVPPHDPAINFEHFWAHVHIEDLDGEYIADFTEVGGPHDISGTVTQGNFGGFDGVTVNFSGLGSVQTHSGGYYSFSVPYGWAGVVSPTRNGYEFSPIYRTYTNVFTDLVDQDFDASAYTTISFTQQPSDTYFDQTMSPLVQVYIGQAIPGTSIQIDLIDNIGGSPDVTLFNVVTDSGGYATFNPNITQPGMGYTLRATVLGPAGGSAISNAFNILTYSDVVPMSANSSEKKRE